MALKLVKQRSRLSKAATVPDLGENMVWPVQNRPVRKQKQAMASFQFATRFDERPYTFRPGCHREDSKAVKTKVFLVYALRPGCLICKKFAIEGGLEERAADDRHRTSVSLQKEIRATETSVRAGKLQCKYAIGNGAQFLTGNSDLPAKPLSFSVVFRDKLSLGKQANLAFPACKLNRYHYVRHKERMLQEHPSDRTVFSIPKKASKVAIKLLLDEQSTFSSETVHEFARASLVIVFDLNAGPLQKAVMIQEFQASQNLLRTSTDKRANMRGAQESIAVHVAYYLAVAFGKLKGCRSGYTSEAGKTE